MADADKPQAHRIKTFHLSPQQVAQAFDHSGPPHVSVVGIPEGFKVLFADFDEKHHNFRFVVQHDSFDEVPIGAAPEELQVTLLVKD